MTSSIDFDGINAAALGDGRSFVEGLLPGGKFRSLEYIVKNPCRNDQLPGSFSINYRSGRWKDFSSGDGGSDIVSLVAYLNGTGQGDAARETADKLGVPFQKTNGSAPCIITEGARSRHTSTQHGDVHGKSNTEPKAYSWGDDGPPRQADELRRHMYSADRVPMRIKIKSCGGRHVNWYRVIADGIPIGWQAKKPEDYQPIPYRSAVLDPFDPELIADDILWPEGEKDVDNLSGLNLPAFTFGGVGDGLPDGIDRYLKDRRLVILADNDEPGRVHAEKKAAVAHAAGAVSIKLVHFRELASKGDVSDFIAQGGTADEIRARIDATPLWSPPLVVRLEPSICKSSALVSLATIKMEATDWLWHHRIPLGAQTISTGWPGVGKSQQQCDIVAHASTGKPWPDGSPCPCGDTIMLTCEDSYARTVTPRLVAAGANLERINALPIIRIDQTKRAFLLTEDLDELERHLSALPYAILVTIDPITGFLGSGKINSNSVTDIRGALAPLSDLAERRNIAIHTVTHPPKTTTSAMNAFIGSQAFIAASRMAYLTTEEMDEESERTGRFLMAMVRSSLGPKLPTLAYRLAQLPVGKDHRDGRTIIGSYVVWEDGVVDISASAALAAASGTAKGNNADHTAKADCIQFLETVLASDWVEVANITAEAISAGLLGDGKQLKDNKPMREAKATLKIETKRDGFGKGARWFWALPGIPWEPHRRPQIPVGALQNERAPMDDGGRL
jgi:AAA domain